MSQFSSLIVVSVLIFVNHEHKNYVLYMQSLKKVTVYYENERINADLLMHGKPILIM